MVTDRREELMAWLEEQERLIGWVTTGEPWSFSGQRGLPGHAFLAQVWRPDGDSLATLDATDTAAEATANAAFIASARTILPLALKAIRGEVEAHIRAESLGVPYCGTCHASDVPDDWPCPTISRLHSALIGGKE